MYAEKIFSKKIKIFSKTPYNLALPSSYIVKGIFQKPFPNIEK